MLTYLLILLIIAVALAPLAHFVPSKRQRKVAGMREYAAVHGLFVEFRDLPGGTAAAGRASRGQIIYYGKRLPHAAPHVSAASWLRDDQGWRSRGKRLPVPEALAQLPADILAASIDQSSCGVYWTESSLEEDVALIRQALEQWCDDIMRE